jgi:hypothetical protein
VALSDVFSIRFLDVSFVMRSRTERIALSRITSPASGPQIPEIVRPALRKRNAVVDLPMASPVSTTGTVVIPDYLSLAISALTAAFLEDIPQAFFALPGTLLPQPF